MADVEGKDHTSEDNRPKQAPTLKLILVHVEDLTLVDQHGAGKEQEGHGENQGCYTGEAGSNGEDKKIVGVGAAKVEALQT